MTKPGIFLLALTALLFSACEKQPTACFTVEDVTLNQGQILQLNNCSEGAAEVVWSFGDGNTSRLFEPDRFYSEDGEFEIKLFAFSKNAYKVDSASVMVTVKSRFLDQIILTRFPQTNTNQGAQGVWDIGNGPDLGWTDGKIWQIAPEPEYTFYDLDIPAGLPLTWDFSGADLAYKNEDISFLLWDAPGTGGATDQNDPTQARSFAVNPFELEPDSIDGTISTRFNTIDYEVEFFFVEGFDGTP